MASLQELTVSDVLPLALYYNTLTPKNNIPDFHIKTKNNCMACVVLEINTPFVVGNEFYFLNP